MSELILELFHPIIRVSNPDQEKSTTRRKKIQLNESIPNKDGSTTSHTTQNSTTVPIEGAHVPSTEDVSLTFNKGIFC
jgi:hypothetical protein